MDNSCALVPRRVPIVLPRYVLNVFQEDEATAIIREGDTVWHLLPEQSLVRVKGFIARVVILVRNVLEGAAHIRTPPSVRNGAVAAAFPLRVYEVMKKSSIEVQRERHIVINVIVIVVLHFLKKTAYGRLQLED
jgi:hypothetical protein